MTRFLLYSHDGVGLGHTCRNLAIARAITSADADATVLLATGSDDAARLGIPERVEVLKLPSLRKVANDQYAARRLLVSAAEIHQLRSRLLTSAVGVFRPHVMLVDKHPLGAGGELQEGLELHRAQGGAAVLGLRDILDDPHTVRSEWAAHDLAWTIARTYDRVLIYGQPGVCDPVKEYGLPASVNDRLEYCGYVARVDDREAGAEEEAELTGGHGWQSARGNLPTVVATVGGGEDGTDLLSVFLEASDGAPWRAVAITGPQAPSAGQARVVALARKVGATLHQFLADPWHRLGGVGAVVCMGGYNTLAEALARQLSIVCVPRIHPRREQLIRAEAFERMGLLKCLRPEVLAPATLREAIRRALRRSRAVVARRCAATLHLDGGARAAALLLDLAHERALAREASDAVEASPCPPRPVRTVNPSLVFA